MAMRPTRKIIADFIGVFLIGALAGGLVTWSYTDTRLSTFMSRTNDPDRMVARIDKKYADEYRLTPDEQSRIEPLTKEMTRRLYQIRRQFGVDVIATLDDYHGKIAEQMDATQREAYEKANEERKKRMSVMLHPDQNLPGQAQK